MGTRRTTLPFARMRAATVDRTSPSGFALREVEWPQPCADEAVVRVAAISLNRCEVKRALSSYEVGMRPGCDLAGTVAIAAADGSGPEEGVRVVCLVRSGAWAEYVAVPTDALAEIPQAVSFSQAATLPVSGLTALHGLSHGGLLAAKRVLVAGAASGVGLLSVQLAHASGAFVVASIEGSAHEALLEDCGADHVVPGEISAAEPFGPYHLIIDPVGGSASTAALRLLRKGGTYVLFGSAGVPEAQLNSHDFFCRGGIKLQSFTLYDELAREPASEGLQRLLALVQTHTLEPLVEFEDAWTDMGAVAQRLLHGDFVGKAVLHL